MIGMAGPRSSSSPAIFRSRSSSIADTTVGSSGIVASRSVNRMGTGPRPCSIQRTAVAGPASKRNGLFQYPIPDSGTKPAGDGDVDFATEEGFQLAVGRSSSAVATEAVPRAECPFPPEARLPSRRHALEEARIRLQAVLEPFLFRLEADEDSCRPAVAGDDDLLALREPEVSGKVVLDVRKRYAFHSGTPDVASQAVACSFVTMVRICTSVSTTS